MRWALSRALCRVGLLAVALGGAALAIPSPAQADPVCGAVLHHSVTLKSDMDCPSTVGLYFGANGITINLNGFTVTGGFNEGIDNAGDWPSNAPGGGGVAGPGAGFNNDTVENGNISQNNGIYVDHTSGMKISHITQGDGLDGLDMYHSRNASVTGSRFGYRDHGNFDSGASVINDPNLTISNSSFNWNGAFGIYDGSTSTTLNHVTANHNGEPDDDPGIQVAEPLSPSLIKNSTANSNSSDGFEATGNPSGTIKFVGNNAENNGGWGFYADTRAAGTSNGYKNDGSGGCHKVGGCHLNP